MTKKQKDAAFIEKCKTIGLSTKHAEALAGDGECPACGGPADHPLSVTVEVRKMKRHDEASEESFAA